MVGMSSRPEAPGFDKRACRLLCRSRESGKVSLRNGGRWVTVPEVTIVSRPFRLPGLLVVAALTAPACGEPEAVTPPPTEVSVVEVSAGRLEEVHEFTGNVE